MRKRNIHVLDANTAVIALPGDGLFEMGRSGGLGRDTQAPAEVAHSDPSPADRSLISGAWSRLSFLRVMSFCFLPANTNKRGPLQLAVAHLSIAG